MIPTKLFSLSLEGMAGEGFSRNYMDSCMIRVENGDTLYMAWLHEVWVYPPMRFKNKKQERFYWRTVRDVKKCMPYAKMIAKESTTINKIDYFLTLTGLRVLYERNHG